MNTGTHDRGLMTFTAAKAINERYLFGALAGEYITPAEGKTHFAIGVITDSANEKDIVNVHILGSNSSTMKVLAGGPIVPGDFITANNLGRAVNYQHEEPGTYQIYGIALSKANLGDHVEFTPISKTI